MAENIKHAAYSYCQLDDQFYYLASTKYVAIFATIQYHKNGFNLTSVEARTDSGF